LKRKEGGTRTSNGVQTGIQRKSRGEKGQLGYWEGRSQGKAFSREMEKTSFPSKAGETKSPGNAEMALRR